jgi:hypothetical protein
MKWGMVKGACSPSWDLLSSHEGEVKRVFVRSRKQRAYLRGRQSSPRHLALPPSAGTFLHLLCPAVSYSKAPTTARPRSANRRFAPDVSARTSVSPSPDAAVLGMGNYDEHGKPSSSPRYDRHLCERRLLPLGFVLCLLRMCSAPAVMRMSTQGRSLPLRRRLAAVRIRGTVRGPPPTVHP